MCAHCAAQVGGEIQLEKGETFQELLRLDHAEDELRTVQDQGIAPRSIVISKLLTQEYVEL